MGIPEESGRDKKGTFFFNGRIVTAPLLHYNAGLFQ